MLNHFRTLLANLPPGSLAGDTIAEEPVPVDFQPLALPSYVLAVRRVLFGADPDRAFVNYRSRQFMTLLHNSRYVDHVLALDSRVSYHTGSNKDLLPCSEFVPTVTPRTSAALLDVPTVTGTPAAPDAGGRMQFVFEVEVLTPETVELKRVSPYPQTVVLPFALTNGASDPLPLAGSGYSLRLYTSQPGRCWDVTILNRPQVSLGGLVASVDSLGEEVLAELFGSSPAEPYLTFSNLWRVASELPDRLCGLLLAVGYRSHEVWLAGRTSSA